MMVDDIRTLLETRGYVDVYCRNMPPMNGTIITLTESGGTSNRDNLRIDMPTLTVYVRSASEADATTTLESIQVSILSAMPYDADSGVHYYKARPFETGRWSGRTKYGFYYVKMQSYMMEVAL
jgi:hypothetical protein